MERVYQNAFTQAQTRVEIIAGPDATTYIFSNGLTHTCPNDDCPEVNELAATLVS